MQILGEQVFVDAGLLKRILCRRSFLFWRWSIPLYAYLSLTISDYIVLSAVTMSNHLELCQTMSDEV